MPKIRDKKHNGSRLKNEKPVSLVVKMGDRILQISPYETNDEVLEAFEGLLKRLENMNQAHFGMCRPPSDDPLEGDFSAGPPAKKAGKRATRLELRKAERNLRLRLEATHMQDNRPPFVDYCDKMGLDFYEQFMLAMVILHDTGHRQRHEGPVFVSLVLFSLGKRFIPLEQVRRYLRKDGRLRSKGLITLVGASPVISKSFIRLNPEIMKEIDRSDYDEDIVRIEGPFDDDGENRPLYTEDMPKRSWETLILPKEVKDAILMGMEQVRYSSVLLEAMGFREILPSGRGVSMLFAGPPGTGKTLAATAVASEFGKKLMTVNYSQLENCWVGATEKNIQKVFQEARKKDAILLFDEADAVFYARGNDERSWANRDVAVLLQELEKFEGVVILTTNQGALLDPALERRVTIKVTFPVPDAIGREAIFRTFVSKPELLGLDVDLKLMAQRHELSGGQIKNVWLNAARMALRRTGGDPKTRITMADLETAARVEEKGGDAMETALNSGKPKGYA